MLKQHVMESLHSWMSFSNSSWSASMENHVLLAQTVIFDWMFVRHLHPSFISVSKLVSSKEDGRHQLKHLIPILDYSIWKIYPLVLLQYFVHLFAPVCQPTSCTPISVKQAGKPISNGGDEVMRNTCLFNSRSNTLALLNSLHSLYQTFCSSE